MRYTIERAVHIYATQENVWRVFTDPSVTKRMGGEYVSSWKNGSPFGWRNLSGKMLSKGTILHIQPGLLLEHNLEDMQDGKLLSTISYRLEPNENGTLLYAREEIHYDTSAEELKEAEDGWEFALQALKQTAETI